MSHTSGQCVSLVPKVVQNRVVPCSHKHRSMQGREQVGGILHSYKLSPATHLGQQVFPEMGGATGGRWLRFRAGWGRALCHSHVGLAGLPVTWEDVYVWHTQPLLCIWRSPRVGREHELWAARDCPDPRGGCFWNKDSRFIILRQVRPATPSPSQGLLSG